MERRSWGRRARRTGQARPSMYFSLVFFPWSALSTLFFLFCQAVWEGGEGVAPV